MRLLGTNTPLSAGVTYQLSCQSAGSRPAAVITWWMDQRQLTAVDEVRTRYVRDMYEGSTRYARGKYEGSLRYVRYMYEVNVMRHEARVMLCCYELCYKTSVRGIKQRKYEVCTR